MIYILKSKCEILQQIHINLTTNLRKLSNFADFFSQNVSTLNALCKANIHYLQKSIVQTVLNFLSFQKMLQVPPSCFWLFHNCRHGKCPLSDFPTWISILYPKIPFQLIMYSYTAYLKGQIKCAKTSYC